MQVYQEMVTKIKNKIYSGELQVGSRLPGENILMDEYGVSRTTVNKATQILRNEGYITTIPKVGTYISKPSSKKFIFVFDLFEDVSSICDKHKTVYKNIIQKGTIYEMKLVELLYIGNKAIAYNVKYMRSEDKDKLNILKEYNFDKRTLPNIFGNYFVTKKSIRCEATLANDEICEALSCNPDEIFMRVTCCYKNDVQLLELDDVTYFLADYYSLVLKPENIVR